MVTGGVWFIPSPHLMAGPVKLLRVAGDMVTVRAHGMGAEWPRQRLQRARLWVTRGQEAWQGPFPCWRAAMAALEYMAPPHALAAVRAGLAAGRGLERGASVVVAGWRYRVAWGGAEPPDRYAV